MDELPVLQQENPNEKELKSIKLTFQKGNKLGKGPHGCVYESLNLSTGEILAVKTIKKEILIENMVFFQRNLLNLKHENLLSYKDFGYYFDNSIQGTVFFY